ncbi:MAG: hypothetical protein IT366_01340 [Candidatus Hydrogenedentes bacterium]|nr:hypothetical protein [Candidatus Hydrogenedentota bacterium]
MTQWTPEAEKQLNEYLARVDALSRANGDDADEIVDGLKQHIRTEAEGKSPLLVTDVHVKHAIASIGTPEQVADVAGDSVARSNGNGRSHVAVEERLKKVRPIYSVSGRSFVILCGLVIPALSLMFELSMGAMAELYADPIPTAWHLAAGVLLLASILATDVFLYMLTRKPAESSQVIARWHNAVFFANAYATTLSLIYAAVYIPILPIAVFALLAFGLGIMGFSPLFCLIAGLFQMRALYRLRAETSTHWAKAVWYSAAGTLLVIAAGSIYAGPRLIAAQVIPMALSENPSERDRGIALIRNLHLEHQVLLTCYSPIVRGIGPTRRWTAEDIARQGACRDLYFRVTGVPYNAVPRPDTRGTFRTRTLMAEDFEDARVTDSEIGGTSVAGRVHGLSLHASTMDVNIMRLGAEGSPHLAYMEWTIEFNNASGRQREARAQIDLPHGAVASRLTLWINGEEREAAFGGRDQVRQAYQSVAVVQRRDPALLNVCGPDKVLLQCFPINAHSTMKLKIGVTAPIVERDGKSYLRLPYISERNFTVPPEFSHGVWVECDAGVEASSKSLQWEEPAPGRIALRGALAENDLQRVDAGTINVSASYTSDDIFLGTLGTQSATMTRQLPNAGSKHPICFVVDGSASMRDTNIPWESILSSVPDDVDVNAVLAGSKVETYEDKSSAPSTTLGEWLASREYVGGCDQVPALVHACDIAGSGGTVIWVHGPLPVELSSVEPLRQWERRRGGASVKILSIEAVPGPNRLLEQCSDLAIIERVPIFESLEETISQVVKIRSPESVSAKFAMGVSDAAVQTAIEPPASHLVRLAVNDAVMRAVQSHQSNEIDALRQVAIEARLVTPLSGAVVLETMEQYARHGLDPTKNEEAIPGVPEPHEWALIVVVCIVLAWVAYQRRQQLRRA